MIEATTQFSLFSLPSTSVAAAAANNYYNSPFPLRVAKHIPPSAAASALHFRFAQSSSISQQSAITTINAEKNYAQNNAGALKEGKEEENQIGFLNNSAVGVWAAQQKQQLQGNQSGGILVETLGGLELHELIGYQHASTVQRLIAATVVILLISAVLIATVILFRCYMLYCQDHLNIRHYQQPPIEDEEQQQQKLQQNYKNNFSECQLDLLIHQPISNNDLGAIGSGEFTPIKKMVDGSSGIGGGGGGKKQQSVSNFSSCCSPSSRMDGRQTVGRYSFRSVFDDESSF